MMNENNPWGNDRFEFPWNKKKPTSSRASTSSTKNEKGNGNGGNGGSGNSSGGDFGPVKPKNNQSQVWRVPVLLIFAVIIGLWLASGFYLVAADQQAVVKRFGKVIDIANPGPHYHMPFPIESVNKAEVTKIHRIEIGYTPGLNNNSMNAGVDVKSEAQMLTGDENIVSVKLIVQYQIKDIIAYLYNVQDVPATIKNAAQSAIREVAGKEKIDELLTVGKNRLQQETLDILQNMLDGYKAGVRIVAVQLLDVNPPQEVDFAFKDVASAREDKNRFINEAEAYANEVIPFARGEAETMIQQAEAYKSQVVEGAIGDAARFEQILKAYKQAPNVTKKRMYLEALEGSLSNANIKIFDSTIKNINPFIGSDKINPSLKKDTK